MDQKKYQQNAAFVPKLTQKLLALAQLQSGETILDLGCGDGVLTKELQRHHSVIGIDNQEDMVAAAKQAGVDARLVPVSQLAEQAFGPFDVVLTNAVLHWIPDIEQHLTAIHDKIKPGGRFVGEFGAFMNIAEILGIVITSMLHHGADMSVIKSITPFYFPTDDVWRSALERSGFRVGSVESEARVTQLPGKVSDWAETFLERYLIHVDRAAVLHDLDTVTDLTSRDESGRFYANYRRIRFVAYK